MRKKPRYCIIGVGEVGPAIGLRLEQDPDTSHICVIDMNENRAAQAVEFLREHRPAEWADTLPITSACHDVRSLSQDMLAGMFGSFDCIISAIPAKHSHKLAGAAARAGVHFCELGGVTAVTEEIRKDQRLASLAQQNGVSIIHDCGFAPGLSGQMGQVLFHRLGGATSIIVYVGGLPQKPLAQAHFWQRTFSGVGMAELLTPPVILQDGIVKTVYPRGFETHELNFNELMRLKTRFGTTVKSRITAGAGVMPEIMKGLGVMNCWEETIRWDWNSFTTFIGNVPQERRASVLEAALPHTSDAHPDIAIMRVVADNGLRRATYELSTWYDRIYSLSAMAKVTGFAAADTARLAVHGLTPAGIMAPEELNWQTNEQLIDGLAGTLGITRRG